MREMAWFKLFPKETLVENDLMDCLQFGAFRRLYYRSWFQSPPASLPNDDPTLAAWLRLPLDTWMGMKSVVLSSFDLKADGRWHQKALRAQYDHVSYRSAKCAEIAKEGWEKRRECQRNANAMRTHSEGYARTSNSKSSSRSGSPGSDGDAGKVGGTGPPPTPESRPAAAVVRLAVAAHAAFGPSPPSYPDPLVLGNVGELLRSGRSEADILALLDWRRNTKHTHKPKSPQSLTDPTRWEQWWTMKAEEKNGTSTDGTRLSFGICADPSKVTVRRLN